MNTCTKCTAIIFPDDKFCGHCGSEIGVDSDHRQKMMTQMELKIEDVRSNLGVVYFKMGKYDDAIACFEKILADEPDNLSAQTMIEMIVEERDKAREA